MKRKEQYKVNKEAKVGETIVCPCCGKSFVKKQYSQAFCSGKCKDKFWNDKSDRHYKGYYREYNNAHPERLEYAKEVAFEKACRSVGIVGNSSRMEAEREAFREYLNNPDFKRYVDEGGLESGGWDEHGCSVDLQTQLENYLGIGIE
jgi:hypothetical protein